MNKLETMAKAIYSRGERLFPNAFYKMTPEEQKQVVLMVKEMRKKQEKNGNFF